MATDVRINEVTTEVTVTDASALLDPIVLERIVRAVLHRLDERERSRQQAERERSLGEPQTRRDVA